MREYLKAFFIRFGYDDSDIDVLIAAYDKICADKYASKAFFEAIKRYDDDMNTDFGELINLSDEAALLCQIHQYTANLLLSLCLTKRAEKYYTDHNISEQIYADTIMDLKYKLDECKAVKGIVGCSVANWFFGFFQLSRFKLGRLQFEVVELKCDYEKEGNLLPEGSKVINVHIPRTLTPLSESECDSAFAMAKEFFKQQIDGRTVFVCSSWMLYPGNREFMNENSNIVKFMNRFDVLKSGVDKDGGNLWRIFDTDERNPYRLPTDSSLRRNLVEYLKCGRHIGWGYGAFYYD